MDPSLPPVTAATTPANDGFTSHDGENGTFALMVDPFLIEALQNARHRLTILRMELDIQKFMQNSEQQQFEFQHFPTSYLRLAAHRVAQHYGLQTMVQDNFSDGQGAKILVRKLPESRYPAVCLSDIPTKMSENDKLDQIKVVLKPRPSKGLLDGSNELGTKRSSVRTVEERKEEYDRARARIFSSPNSAESEDASLQPPIEGKSLYYSGDENDSSKNSIMDFSREGTTSRVAILRDREKDRTDPDYDRSYERYVKNLPTGQSFSMVPFGLQKFQPQFVQYESLAPQMVQMPRSQAPVGYGGPMMNPFVGLNQTSRDAVYMQLPSHAMMYAHSYDQFRHAVFQAPFCQQPLSFDYSQNY